MAELNTNFGLFSNYFKPTLYLESFTSINVDSLKNDGIKVVLCDLDNTLIGLNERIPNNRILKFLRDLEKANIVFILFSNNIKTRVETFAKKAKIKNYIWNAKKPFVTKFKQIKKILPFYQENEIVMIGDQLITDVLFANRCHIKSILVEPLKDDGRKRNKVIYFLEKIIFKRLAKKNILHKGFYFNEEEEKSYEIL